MKVLNNNDLIKEVMVIQVEDWNTDKEAQDVLCQDDNYIIDLLDKPTGLELSGKRFIVVKVKNK